MEVMCIATGGWETRIKVLWIFRWWRDGSGPKFGDFLTVSDQDFWDGEKYYSFEEWPEENYYNSKHFIPIQSVEESEKAKQPHHDQSA